MIDLRMTETGELVISVEGDLDFVYGDEQIAQEVLFRLKTTLGDWSLSPNVGASLERFIGEPNTPIIHKMIESEIVKSITKDNLLFLPYVKVIPIEENKVFILIEFGSIEDEERVIQVQSGLDLKKGLVFAKIGSREQQ
jgi:phage baseplate assembly protein W